MRTVNKREFDKTIKQQVGRQGTAFFQVVGNQGK